MLSSVDVCVIHGLHLVRGAAVVFEPSGAIVEVQRAFLVGRAVYIPRVAQKNVYEECDGTGEECERIE